ncbi:MAG: GIY-YIG nuclease family protein [Acidobacteria bacterium]|nr:GIY-YIG nuclease family protein [Acidobacteriota bacterium]
MPAATIKMFLPDGDAKGLRIAEIMNWTGKAVAAPRTDLDALFQREETKQTGIYILTGINPDSGKAEAYIGEAEVIRDRLKQHQGREFWNNVFLFVSKDENLTKSHVKYLEGRLIEQANSAGRTALTNSKNSGAKLPESDRADMEAFLERIHQLLPVLGSDLLIPIVTSKSDTQGELGILTCEIKGLIAKGQVVPNGFVIHRGSQAVLNDRPSAERQHPYVVSLRKSLIADGSLIGRNDHLTFTKDIEFTSPSAAASVVHGGGANGLIQWKDEDGRTLKDLEALGKKDSWQL